MVIPDPFDCEGFPKLNGDLKKSHLELYKRVEKVEKTKKDIMIL